MKKIFLTLAITITSYCSYAQYLPLTAGSGNPLTGDLHIDGTNGNRIIFSYGGISNNKVLLGSTYSIFGSGSKDDFATYIRDTNPYSIWTNNLQRLTVDGNGNVGIGTTSPLSLFSVGSSSQFQVSLSGNTTIGGDLNVAGTLRSYGPGAFDSNTAIGDFALSANTTGVWNVAIGRNAGRLLQTGQYNVFVGGGAAGSGIGTGNYNNGVGFGALNNLSSGTYNNAFGANAGGAITTGISNTMMGDVSGLNVTTSSSNTGIGYGAGMSSSGGNWTAVGAYALKDGGVSAKDGSTAVGEQALQITTGSYNTAIGIKAGYDMNTGSTLTGSYNSYLGTYAGQGNITGSYNTFIGYNSSLGSVNNYVVIADGQGHNRMVINDAGNVGIGTTSPSYLLDVNGIFRTTGDIIAPSINGQYIGYGAGGSSTVSFAAGNNVLGSATSSALYNVALGYQVMSSTTTGSANVAIGFGTLNTNTTGGTNIAVGKTALGYNTTGNNSIGIGSQALRYANSDNNSAIGTYAGEGVTTGSGNTFLGYLSGTTVTTGSNNIMLGLSPSIYDPGITTGSNNTIIGSNISGLSPTLNNHIILGDGSGNQRLVIDDNGKVGISTASPGRNLDVVGGGGSALSGTGFSVSGMYQDHTAYKGIELGYDTSDQIGIIAGASGGAPSNLAFWTYNGSGSWLEGMRVNSSGNVSIGTTDPQGYKLAVNGSVIATSVKVKAYGNWPDYVFGKSHELMPLADLKAYVDKNQHLPEIPSAAEVEKNGQDLGEMNKILVKKVEELTLYLIEKDKQDKARQKEVDELKKQVELLLKASQKDKQ